jgi:hypothetical protein
MWITNGTLTGEDTGDIFLVHARTGEKHANITQFIVEKNMPGFTNLEIERIGLAAAMAMDWMPMASNCTVPKCPRRWPIEPFKSWVVMDMLVNMWWSGYGGMPSCSRLEMGRMKVIIKTCLEI